jgi:hypothetical protein
MRSWTLASAGPTGPRQTDPLVEVEVMRIGTTRPARALARFVDDSFEGKQEWVPPARLKVPWVDVDRFRRRERL